MYLFKLQTILLPITQELGSAATWEKPQKAKVSSRAFRAQCFGTDKTCSIFTNTVARAKGHCSWMKQFEFDRKTLSGKGWRHVSSDLEGGLPRHVWISLFAWVKTILDLPFLIFWYLTWFFSMEKWQISLGSKHARNSSIGLQQGLRRCPHGSPWVYTSCIIEFIYVPSATMLSCVWISLSLRVTTSQQATTGRRAYFSTRAQKFSCWMKNSPCAHIGTAPLSETVKLLLWECGQRISICLLKVFKRLRVQSISQRERLPSIRDCRSVFWGDGGQWIYWQCSFVWDSEFGLSENVGRGFLSACWVRVQSISQRDCPPSESQR